MLVALLIGLGCGAGMFVLILAIGFPLQRWADRSGAFGDKPQVPFKRTIPVLAYLCGGMA